MKRFTRIFLFMWVLLSFVLLMIAFSSCKKTKVVSDNTTTTEKVNIKLRDTTVTIPGFELSGSFNLDSLMEEIKKSVPVGERKIVYVKDPKTEALLKIVVDEQNRLLAECSAKDRTKTFTLADVERIIKQEREIILQEQKTKFGQLWTDLKTGFFIFLFLIVVALVFYFIQMFRI